jgi:hypothetical protein
MRESPSLRKQKARSEIDCGERETGISISSRKAEMCGGNVSLGLLSNENFQWPGWLKEF